jgi:hypothetical protein
VKARTRQSRHGTRAERRGRVPDGVLVHACQYATRNETGSILARPESDTQASSFFTFASTARVAHVPCKAGLKDQTTRDGWCRGTEDRSVYTSESSVRLFINCHKFPVVSDGFETLTA